MVEFVSRSPETTARLGFQLGRCIKPGTVLCLDGDLGAGKTLFVQNLAKGMDITEDVTSPTFNLMNIYEGRLRLYHFDLYRLEQEYELEDIGFYDYTSTYDGVVVIEWANKFSGCLPEDYILINIDRVDSDDNKRCITVTQVGNALDDMYKEVEGLCRF